MKFQSKAKQIIILINRLERLSADSIWSHRACGLRGSLMEYMEKLDVNNSEKSSDYLESILDQGYYVLEQAVKFRLTSTRIKGKNGGFK